MKLGIACYPTHGGSGVIATELGLALADRGHEVHFFSYSSPFRLSGFHQQIFFHEVNVSSYPLFKYPPYALSLATKMATVANERGIDIFHVHYAVPHAVSAILARQLIASCHPKIITTLHGTDITLVGRDESYYDIVHYSIEQSDGVTAVSEFLRRQTQEQFNIKHPIEVIYNFIDPERCRVKIDSVCRRRFAADEEKLIVHISNFRPVKRVQDVVAIFKKIRSALPAKLLLIGEGPEHSKICQLVKSLNLDKDVIFLGTQDYPEDILACGDLFLLPSEQESFGLVALEAMGCGCPVIGARSGGLPEVVHHGETGFLFQLGDVEAMAKKAIEILQNDEQLNILRLNAKKRAVEKFPSDEIIPQYEQYYYKILQQK